MPLTGNARVIPVCACVHPNDPSRANVMQGCVWDAVHHALVLRRVLESADDRLVALLGQNPEAPVESSSAVLIPRKASATSAAASHFIPFTQTLISLNPRIIRAAVAFLTSSNRTPAPSIRQRASLSPRTSGGGARLASGHWANECPACLRATVHGATSATATRHTHRRERGDGANSFAHGVDAMAPLDSHARIYERAAAIRCGDGTLSSMPDPGGVQKGARYQRASAGDTRGCSESWRAVVSPRYWSPPRSATALTRASVPRWLFLLLAGQQRSPQHPQQLVETLILP